MASIYEHSENLYRDKKEKWPRVLHQSENFLCISKCWDIQINSDNPTEMTTEQQLRQMCPQLVTEHCKHSFWFVHRLDYGTSGALCLGLKKKAASQLSEAFRQRKVVKYYLALVRGHLEDTSLFIDIATGELLDTDWPGRRCVANHKACSKAQDTRTLLVCLEKGTYDGKPVSKVLMKPYTGRQHQLRVHCNFIGHTIVGDYTYSNRADTDPQRMMLHSHWLRADIGLEKLNIDAGDPFTPEFDPKWTPCETVHLYDDAIKITENFIPGEGQFKIVTLSEINDKDPT